MSTSVIETVAKYFYLSTLDEAKSFAGSLRALSELRKNDWMSPERRDRWVYTLSKWSQKVHRLPLSQTRSFNGEAFSIPEPLNWVAWTNFLTNGEMSEVEALIFSRVLGFSDDEIAKGLGITVGTVRYRVGRALRHLGGFLEY